MVFDQRRCRANEGVGWFCCEMMSTSMEKRNGVVVFYPNQEGFLSGKEGLPLTRSSRDYRQSRAITFLVSAMNIQMNRQHEQNIKKITQDTCGQEAPFAWWSYSPPQHMLSIESGSIHDTSSQTASCHIQPDLRFDGALSEVGDQEKHVRHSRKVDFDNTTKCVLRKPPNDANPISDQPPRILLTFCLSQAKLIHPFTYSSLQIQCWTGRLLPIQFTGRGPIELRPRHTGSCVGTNWRWYSEQWIGQLAECYEDVIRNQLTRSCVLRYVDESPKSRQGLCYASRRRNRLRVSVRTYSTKEIYGFSYLYMPDKASWARILHT